MANSLPSTPSLHTVTDHSEIRSFLDELEAVALSCQTVLTAPVEAAGQPTTYLESIAEKYSFAPPRSSFYRQEVPVHCENVKSIIPNGIVWQFNKKCRDLLGSISTMQR